eukprot:TRINITY_DN38504_c0_g1_i1.p1 TRINITY_DN38504_c0_g1~~TRINITY_DN38504_c0_g1_i1.p1  ORF type:complete len:458 (+),score=187.93 TRINITY_DN38504_c0_g1_i1:142-1515(+)
MCIRDRYQRRVRGALLQITMSLKPDVDHSKEVDELLPQNTELGTKHGKLAEAVENLLGLEKRCRLHNDWKSVERVCLGIVQACFQCKDQAQLNENVVLLCKRRGQSKTAQTKVVQEVMSYLDSLDSEEATVELIQTLRAVTEGKIFVELERARLTRRLCTIKETAGNIKEACDTLNEVQIETVASMERREKAEFVLEQMRLLLKNGDYARTNIVSKKLAKKVLKDESFEDVKITFNEYMLQYHDHKDNYMEIFRCYNAILNTSIVKNDQDQLVDVLKKATSFLVLAPHDNEQHDFLHRLKEEAALEKIPSYLQMYKLMTTKELIVWATVESDLKADFYGTGAFGGEHAERRWGVFKDRVTEYNIRIIGTYYDRMTIKRLTELLNLSQDETEAIVSKLVTDDIVWARMDRPAGVIVFQKPCGVDDVLNVWSGNIDSLLDKVEKCCHLIYKENIAHKVR